MAGDGIKGDFDALGELREQVKELSRASTRSTFSKLCGASALQLLQREFETSTDPTGKAWAPLKRRDGQPLLDTGRLRNSFGITHANSGGFTLGTNVLYAEVHQSGATIEHPPRVNAHNRRGRFVARSKTSRIKRAVRISYTGTFTTKIPARPMVPENELPPRWQKAFEDEADELLRLLGFGGE
jgi:phage gpG-like protein